MSISEKPQHLEYLLEYLFADGSLILSRIHVYMLLRTYTLIMTFLTENIYIYVRC